MKMSKATMKIETDGGKRWYVVHDGTGARWSYESKKDAQTHLKNTKY